MSKKFYEQLAQEITDKVITQMEKGVIPWDKPWTVSGCGIHNSYSTKKPYSMLNQILLSCQGAYDSEYNEYATFNAIKKAGGKVNKGAKAKVIYECFIKCVAVEKENEQGEKETLIIPNYYAKKQLVFNVALDTNLTVEKPQSETKTNDIITEAEAIINNYVEREKLTFQNTDLSGAYYSPSLDMVNVPPIEIFKDSNSYYGVCFHELTHSTGSTKRLNRIKNIASFGNEEYSKEELVAEIGSYIIANTCGISTDKMQKNNIAYLQGWISALQNDKTMFVRAMQQASKAVEMILA